MKRLTLHEKLEFIPGTQDFLIFENQFMLFTILLE